MPFQVAPGGDPESPASAAALRELLKALRLSSKQAAARAGMTEGDVARLCSGMAHLVGPPTKWDRRKERHTGVWAEFCEKLFVVPPEGPQP